MKHICICIIYPDLYKIRKNWSGGKVHFQLVKIRDEQRKSIFMQLFPCKQKWIWRQDFSLLILALLRGSGQTKCSVPKLESKVEHQKNCWVFNHHHCEVLISQSEIEENKSSCSCCEIQWRRRKKQGVYKKNIKSHFLI